MDALRQVAQQGTEDFTPIHRRDNLLCHSFVYHYLFFLSMVGAGIIVDVLFAALGLIPKGPRPESMAAHAQFAWNYTTWLDLVAVSIFMVLVTIYRRSRSDGVDGQGHSGHPHHQDEQAGHLH